jgi:hypothetical protein
MAGDSGGREQNFWPGFVDALSNVVLVMIFVVVVFVVTLFYYSQKLAQFKAKKLVERVEQNDVAAPAKTPSLKPSSSPAAPDDSKQIASLKVQVATLQAQLAAASSNPAAISGSMNSEAPAINKVIEVKQADKKATDPLPGIKIDKTAEAITLVFDKDGVELTPEANKAMDVNLERWVAPLKAGQAKLVITGVVASLSYSEGKRRAYYRAIAVRNHLLELGVPTSSLVTRVVPGAEGANNDAKVIVQYATSSKP